MKKWIVGMLAALMALSLCACGNGGDRSAASESISNSAWAAIVGETLGEDTYHILVFTDGGDGKGNVEYAIQVGDNTIYDVRGTFTMKKNNIMETKYQEQIKNGAWGPIDEGRVDEDRLQYEVEDGQVTALYRVDDQGNWTDTFYRLQ